jgi:O-antigen ligase
LWVPLTCAWLLALTTFSAPNRTGPETAGELDMIALAKLGVRVLVLGALGTVLVRLRNHPRFSTVMWTLAPLGVFVAWSLVSTLWSPLKAVSIGQANGLLAQVMLVAALAILWRGPETACVVLGHLAAMLFTVSFVLMAVYCVDPMATGLVREHELEMASYGMVHPTSGGATASLGILLVAACRMLWGWRWSRLMLWPGLAFHGAVVLLAASRTAAFLSVVLLAVVVCFFTRKQVLAGAALVIGVLGTMYLVADPGLCVTDSILNTVTTYAKRGETSDQLNSLTGRDVLWEAIWGSYLESPVIGHGYFVTSKDGLLDVWNGPGNHSSHNVGLQILVGTGLIGLLLSLVGFGWPMVAGAMGVCADPAAGRLRAMLLLAGVWYLVWGQLCESFMGPVQPESVVFFTLFGAVTGCVPVTQTEATPEAAAAEVATTDRLAGVRG